jgi:hypothetical protein
MAEIEDKTKAEEKAEVKKTPWAKLNLNEIPLHLIPMTLNRIPLRKVTGLLNKIIPKQERKQTEKVLSYLRIYTHLVNAYDMIDPEHCQRAFDHILIVKNLTKEVSYRGEKSYLENINQIAKDILKKRRSIVRRLNKYQASDPAHSKTNLLLAQNICVLRIMKIAK